MPLPYVLDEDSRHRALWQAIQDYNTNQPTEYQIDAVRVGDQDGPDSGMQDPDLISWACDHKRIIVSGDKNTLIEHHAQAVGRGITTPGLMIIKRNTPHAELAKFLGLYSAVRDERYCKNLWMRMFENQATFLVSFSPSMNLIP